MAYMSCTGFCVSCHQLFSFHPNKVPSVTVNGTREPVCRSCVERFNPIRKEKGLPEINVLPGAYEAADESEIDWS